MNKNEFQREDKKLLKQKERKKERKKERLLLKTEE